MKHLRGLTILAVAASLEGCGQNQNPPLPPPAPPRTPVVKAKPVEEAEPKPDHKSIVTLTPGAAAHARALMVEVGAKYVRVSVSSEFEYNLHAESHRDRSEDDFGESLGVPIVVDRVSASRFEAGLRVDLLAGQDPPSFRFTPVDPDRGRRLTLVEARKGFRTTLARRVSADFTGVGQPPRKVFRAVEYPTPLGKMSAFLTPDPKDGKLYPAIIWITGGDCNSIDKGCWEEGPANNDQSASAYRKAGIAMMFPSLRGGNSNPGVKEGLFGEVDDVLAAADYLRKQPFVDPERIYLGGHSTGGTLALLTAECSDRFRAVFSFGPVDDMAGYDAEYKPFSTKDPKELQLRAPGRWLHAIASPVFVFEGSGGNWQPLRAMARASKNPNVKFFEIKNGDHFGVLGPTNKLIAQKILADTGPKCDLRFDEDELNKPFAKR